MKVMLIFPAYGRKYNTTEETVKDWYEGKDFLINDGPYCSIRNSKEIMMVGYSHVQIVDYDTDTTLAVIYLGEIQR